MRQLTEVFVCARVCTCTRALYSYCMRFEDLDIYRRSEDPLLIWTLHRRLFQYILFMKGNFQIGNVENYIVSIFGFYEIAIYLFVNVFEGNEDPFNLSALRGQCLIFQCLPTLRGL